MPTLNDLTSKKFGLLTVLKRAENRVTESGQIKTYWHCRCTCGSEKIIYSNSLIAGRTKACGKCLRPNRKPKGVAALRNVFCSYKGKCRRKNIEFKLTEDEFFSLTKQNCYYCGEAPANLHGKIGFNGSCLYNGIDRVNNNLGYTSDNVVPSCKKCNLAKRTLSKEEFIKLVVKIYERHVK